MFSAMVPASSQVFFEASDTVISQNMQDFSTRNGVQYPLKTIKVTQGYRYFHPGIDYDGDYGDSVFPIAAGAVEATQESRYAYGNAVLVNHNGSEFSSLYAHLSVVEVSVGQNVTTDTKIGEVGSTGRSSGTHLHLEIREGNRQINPNLVLPDLE